MISNYIWSLEIDSPKKERADKCILKSFLEKKGLWTCFDAHSKPTFIEQDPFQIFHFTRSQFLKLFHEHRIKLRGSPIKPSIFLKKGDFIEVHCAPPHTLELIPENLPLDILYDDSDLCIINKPALLSVHPSDTEKTNTLVHRILYHMSDLSGIGGVIRPGIVHRIDKNTTGSLLIAKNDFTHQHLSKQFSEHSIERKYWALVLNAPEFQTKKCETWIGRHPVQRKKMAVLSSGGRKAISIFHLKKIFHLHKNLKISLIEAELTTGRTHQVRASLPLKTSTPCGPPLQPSLTSRPTF